MAIFKQAERGVPVSELCRENRMSSVDFYKWWAKFDCMDVSVFAEMKDMVEQNRCFTKIYSGIHL